MGYQAPNYFQVPIAWYERLGTIQNASEVKVTLAVFRRTFGWHKRGDRISLTQLQQETGMTRKAVVDGVEKALDRGTITREKAGDSWVYRVDIYYADDAPRSDSGASSEEAKSAQPPAGAPPSTPSKDAQAVFEHWLALCDEHDQHPRSREITPSRRRLIDKALKEASVDECKAALTGLFVTDWYSERGYYDMRYVFQTKPGGKSLREQIDHFIDMAEAVGRGLAITSVDPETLNRAKAAVLEAHDLSGNETAVARGARAEEWLKQHGVIVDRSGKRPVFRKAAA